MDEDSKKADNDTPDLTERNPFANMFADHVAKITKGKMPAARTAKGILKPPPGKKTHRTPKEYVPMWQLPTTAKPVAAEEPAQRTPENISLADEFGTVVRQGEERTGFQRRRIEFYLPEDLKTAFDRYRQSHILTAQDQKSRTLIEYVRNLYETLPGKNDNASPREIEYYAINGKPITSLPMSKEVAVRQIAHARKNAATPVTDNQIVRRLSGKFTPTAIHDVLDNRGNHLPERKLVAHILTIIGPARQIG